VVRLIAYNIEYCEGISHGAWEYLNAAHLLRSPQGLDKKMASYLASKDPDVLGLVEVDTGSIRSQHRDEAQFFADALGLEHVVKTNKYDGSDYSHRLLRHLPIFKYQNNAVLSSYAVQSAAFHTLSKGVKNIAIQVTFSEPTPHTILLVHLALFRGARKQQIRDLHDVITGIPTPLIVCGDFNTFKSDELNELLEETRLQDAYVESNGVQKNTAPTWNPKHRLDNVLHTPEITVDNYKVLDASFSDHLPVQLDYSVSTK
jgi:endonuclease/exonuclease/phosphatase family metal-dependent hydrolase